MKAYSNQETEGVKVFYSPNILLNQRAMQIMLGGFWRFRWLKVVGVAPPPACCG